MTAWCGVYAAGISRGLSDVECAAIADWALKQAVMRKLASYMESK